MADTKEQFEKVISQCRELFEKKLKDYGLVANHASAVADRPDIY